MRCMTLLIAILAWSPSFAASAAADKLHVTDQEKAACAEDAIRLCISAYPDEGKLISCMRSNRSQLSPNCLVVFNAGLKRRHMQ